MHGLHLTADLYHCRCASRWLTDAAFLGEHGVQATALTSLLDAGDVERHRLMRGVIAA